MVESMGASANDAKQGEPRDSPTRAKIEIEGKRITWSDMHQCKALKVRNAGERVISGAAKV